MLWTLVHLAKEAKVEKEIGVSEEEKVTQKGHGRTKAVRAPGRIKEKAKEETKARAPKEIKAKEKEKARLVMGTRIGIRTAGSAGSEDTLPPTAGVQILGTLLARRCGVHHRRKAEEKAARKVQKEQTCWSKSQRQRPAL